MSVPEPGEIRCKGCGSYRCDAYYCEKICVSELRAHIAELEAALDMWHVMPRCSTWRCGGGSGCHLDCPCSCHDQNEDFQSYRNRAWARGGSEVSEWGCYLMDVLDCKRCPLSASTNPIAGFGNQRARLMVVGMAPGAQEESQRLPFVGPAGKLLREVLFTLGLDPNTAFMTNTVRCRPKEDGKNRDPSPAELAACAPWLKRELELVDPDVLLLLGKTAIPIAWPGKRPSEAAGLVRAVELAGRARTCVAGYHPAAVLRQRGLLGSLTYSVAAAIRLLTPTT